MTQYADVITEPASFQDMRVLAMTLPADVILRPGTTPGNEVAPDDTDGRCCPRLRVMRGAFSPARS